MNLKKENIYIKAKQLRSLINETFISTPFEDSDLREMLIKLSLQVPFQIGLSLKLPSIENTRLHLEKAEKKLIELYIAIDLSIPEYLQIDSTKLDSLVEEIFDLIPITLAQAEEEEEKRMDEIMKEFMVKEV